MSQHPQDDGFHEIQLNGKQLVFLFMAATVVSVVIFLCGVLVGRGVRAERGTAVTDTAALAAGGDPAGPPASAGQPAAPPAGSDPTAAPPPPEVDDLSYFNRLEKQNAPAEDLKPTKAGSPEAKPAPAAPAKAAAETRASTPPPPPAENEKQAAPKMALPPPPSGGGFALQVAALREREEAESIARRLSSKGYSAYVLSPATGTPSVFRVRVGTFKTRREAEAVAAKLQKEEQFKPWITR